MTDAKPVPVTLETLAGQIGELKETTDDLQATTDYLKEITDDLRKSTADLRKSTDARFDELKAQIRTQIKGLRREMIRHVRREIGHVRREIADQSKEDRRHFTMLAEDVRDSIRIVAEATAHNTARLTNHEIADPSPVGETSLRAIVRAIV